MALPVWGGLLIFWVLEVVDQNLAELAHFAPPSPGKGRREIVLEGSIPSDFHLSESLRKEAGAKTRCGQRARARSDLPIFTLLAGKQTPFPGSEVLVQPRTGLGC